MKLLLTSAGLKNQKIRDFFVGQFDMLENKKACLIFTIREESDWQWLDLYNKELNDIGLAYDKLNISEDKNFREKRKGELVIPLTDDRAVFIEDGEMVLI